MNSHFLKLTCWKQEEHVSVRIWATVTKTKLWKIDDWVRASPIQQVLWGVGCSVCSGQYLPTSKNHRHPRLIDAREERRVAHLVQSLTNHKLLKKLTVAMIHTVHHSLLHVGLSSHRLVWVRLVTVRSSFKLNPVPPWPLPAPEMFLHVGPCLVCFCVCTYSKDAHVHAWSAYECVSEGREEDDCYCAVILGMISLANVLWVRKW